MPTCAYCNANAIYRDRESGAYLCPVQALKIEEAE